MICHFCKKDTAEPREEGYHGRSMPRRWISEGYRIACTNEKCLAKGPRRSSKALAETAWNRAMPAPEPAPQPVPAITINRLSQQVAEAAYSLSGTPEFIGFRWMNIKKAHNCVREQLRLLKKTGRLKRNRLGEPLLAAEDVSEVFERAITPFLDRMKRRLKNTGTADDNGYTDNCLLALQKIYNSVWPEKEHG